MASHDEQAFAAVPSGELSVTAPPLSAGARMRHALGERIKELTLLHHAARVLGDDGRPLEDVLRELVEAVPPAWQYPEVTAARIRIDAMQLATVNFTDSPWAQRAAFRTAWGADGEIAVVYLAERPPEAEGPFLAEERALIESLADMVRIDLDRRRALIELRSMNAQLEQRVAERTAELRRKNRELEAFSYSVAHDLKAPLRGIDGYSRLLLDEHAHQLDADGRTMLHAVRGSARRMGQLIDDLLAYSRLELRTFAMERTHLPSIIGALVDERRPDLAEAGITIALAVDLGDVDCDAPALRLALRNYLDNAIKFSRGVASPHITIGAEPIGAEPATRHRVWVRDNGIGFDMAHHDKIFEVFQRLHTEDDRPGTGIGLALVRKAMERHWGRAWAESAPGRGATFFLEFPRWATPPDLR